MRLSKIGFGELRKRRWLGVTLCLLIALLIFVFAFKPTLLFPAQDRTWQTVQQQHIWRVGTDPSFPPFEQLNANSQPVGYDIDLAQHMATAWGVKLEIVSIGFDSLLDALQTGKVDSVISALPYDERMTQNVAYSAPYFEAGIRLAVRKGSSITSVEQLASPKSASQTAPKIVPKIAVEWGSTGDMVGRRLQRTEPTIQLMPFSTPEEAVDAFVHNQAITALLIDQVTLRQVQGKGIAIQAVGPALESNPYVIAMPRTATVLQMQIAQTLHDLQARGVLAQLEHQWFDQTGH